MSDEMKPTSEDAKITAGNAPRRDSGGSGGPYRGVAVFVFLHLKRYVRARRRSAPSLSLATRVGIAALAVVSVLFIGASAFALTNGFGLPADSPVVKAAESVGIVRSVDVEASSADGADEAKAGKGEDSNEADAANKESEDKKDASSDASGSDESKSKGDGSSSDNSASSGSSDSGSSSSSNSSPSSSAGSGSGASSSGASSSSSSSAGGSSQPGTSAPAGTVTVYVSVSSSAVGNPVSGGGTFTFNQGATVYDALCACGLSMNASNTGYGIYVSAIGGLAEKEHGGHSGWMYSVNGAVPMTACSNYVLLNGDSVSWYYVTG